MARFQLLYTICINSSVTGTKFPGHVVDGRCGEVQAFSGGFTG